VSPPQASPQVIVDSNEALPQHRGYRFPGDRVLPLDCADYSAVEAIDVLRIERKSLADFLGCVGSRRAEFERNTMRPMTAYPYRYLLCEFSLPDLAAGAWTRPAIRPAAAIGSLFAWTVRYGVAPLFCSDAAHARSAVLRIVQHVVKHTQTTQEPNP